MMLLHFLFMASKLRSVSGFFEVIMKRTGSKETAACHMVDMYLRGDRLVNLIMTPCVSGMQINHLLNVGVLL